MNSALSPGWKTSEFLTMLLGNVIAVLMAKGVLTPNDAQTLSGALPIIGAIILSVISTAGFIFSRLLLKLRLGPVPTFDTPDPAANAAPAQATSPASPSYAPPTTGTIGDQPIPTDTPDSAV